MVILSSSSYRLVVSRQAASERFENCEYTRSRPINSRGLSQPLPQRQKGAAYQTTTHQAPVSAFALLCHARGTYDTSPSVSLWQMHRLDPFIWKLIALFALRFRWSEAVFWLSTTGTTSVLGWSTLPKHCLCPTRWRSLIASLGNRATMKKAGSRAWITS